MTGHNEVVYWTNTSTHEIEHKFYDPEATHGFVTHLKVSANILAIGYSNGTIIIIDLDLANADKDEDNHNKLVF